VHTLTATTLAAAADAAITTADCVQVPMVFWGEQFWKDSCIYDALEKNSRDRPMHKWVSHILSFLWCTQYMLCIHATVSCDSTVERLFELMGAVPAQAFMVFVRDNQNTHALLCGRASSGSLNGTRITAVSVGY
jgi:hypothetical protein